eukprot:NODE_29773_length_436_cov_5.097087.p4 GENE.NODE_29773_length_436_cov_5.097087~~NODE_29773_length_436_cov_5.097087.p4  ORF type:complete len:58 (+),score=6.59 NODE_29773_length_436_cov_5.097087:66-239(+)
MYIVDLIKIVGVTMWVFFQLFFFKQKTEYEISACLVGSALCWRCWGLISRSHRREML